MTVFNCSRRYGRYAAIASLAIAAACGDGGGDKRTGAQRRLAARLSKAAEESAEKMREQVSRDSLNIAASEKVKEQPFVLMRGYFVRGTDEQSFKDCATGRVHFLRAEGEQSYLLQQYYRWYALATMTPVYLELHGRVIDDSLRLNENLYTSVVEVKRLVSDPGPKACKSPSRGSLVARSDVNAR